MIRVVVTGIGIISSIGNNLQETYDSLINKKSGIGNIDILETKHKGEFLVGEIKLTHEELMELAEVDSTLAWTRTALLGVIAAKQAIVDSGINDCKDVSLISASTVGGMDRSEKYYHDFLTDAKHCRYIDSHHAGNSTEMIAEQCGVGGYITTVSTACSSSLNSIMFGARLIKSGETKTAIVGGTDALSKFTVNGFNTLMILDNDHCRPFDISRTGLNLGEGAAYLVIEEMGAAISAGKTIYAEVTGYANANDAYHQTASSDSGDGPYLAMKEALKVASLNPEDIDYINAHGTGTDNNDLTEGRALIRLFGDNIPAFSSTKAYTGHTLGAAGVIESVISILSLINKVAMPNINFSNPIEEIDIRPISEITEIKDMNNVLTNSFGFGGNDSSVIFSRISDDNISNTSSSDISKNQPVYIIGMACVSPQLTIEGNSIPEDIIEPEGSFFQIQKPNYREYIDPKLLRRMSKIIRMGIVSAKVAMKNANVDHPDAIITGTGMGCQIDTEKFLNSLINNEEELLTPTSFIQSTHNTVGGTIALGHQNHNYNLTYVHRTFSFESALVDSMLLLNEKKSENILVGGFDEITDESWLIKTKIGHYKAEKLSSTDLFKDEQKGALAGEGSSFFVLSSQKSDKAYAKVVGVDMFFRPENTNAVQDRITNFLSKHELSIEDIDLVILGNNGDKEFDNNYQELEQTIFINSSTINYKNLCGEYDTSSAFAMWLGSNIIKDNKVPAALSVRKTMPSIINNVLIYNHFRSINHSLILLSNAD